MSTPTRSLRGTAETDAVFAALADPTRRAALTALRAGERTISELSAEHPIALPSFMKHVHVLEAAGLITTRKVGRVRRCALTERGLEPAETWMRDHTAHWTASLERLAHHVEETT